MCQSHTVTVQKKESKSDEWFSSLQYLNASINDLTIPESFLDNGSEFGVMPSDGKLTGHLTSI